LATARADGGVAGFFKAYAGVQVFGDLLFGMELNLVRLQRTTVAMK